MGLKRYKLGDLIEVTRGQSLAGEFYAEEGKYIRLTLGNFDYANGGFKPNTSKTNLYYTGPIKEQFILEEGDIITPLTEQTPGLLGSTARIPISGTYIQSQDVALVRCKDGMIDPAFCYYLLPSSSVKKQLAAGAQQTKIRHTSPDKIKDVVVDIPDISEQRQIGQLLDAITHKIELNRSINQNLEALAKQLYDYWFVQFDFPNEEGKPYKSSGGKMVWNETIKRDIPERWEVLYLGEITTKYQQGLIRSNSQLSDSYDYGYLKMGDLYGNGRYSLSKISRTSATKEELSAYSLHKGDFLINVRNSKEIVGKTCIVNYVEDNTLYNHMLVRMCFEKVSSYYINLLFNTKHMRKAVDGIKKGTTTVIALYQDDLYRLPIIVPNNETMKKFSTISNRILDNQALLDEEELSLVKQRDELLPLLMNGQVSLNSDLSND